ncbi:MAG: hypothetical protein KDD65_10550 [Bacteroidetes bacterium]|nr:hypothetical protein [Bacteroidota bacterium]
MRRTSARLIATLSLVCVAYVAAPETADAQVKPEMAFQFGPTVGLELSPDAATVGAFFLVHNALVNLTALKFMAEATYGFGLQDLGPNASYNTFRLAVTALYLVALSNPAFALYPLAGLAYYRYNWSYDGFNGIGFSPSYNDIVLVVGAAAMYNNFLGRVNLGLGGGSDFTIGVGYAFGSAPAAE